MHITGQLLNYGKMDYVTTFIPDSVMHYGPKAFSKNGRITIRARRKGVLIGQRLGMSDTDVFKINKLYKCSDTVTSAPTGTVILHVAFDWEKFSVC